MFSIEYCGYHIHNPNHDIIYRANGSQNYLFLLILAPMYFYFEKKHTLAKSGACILYTPNTPQHYQSIDEFYNSYIHFTASTPFLSSYSFPINEIFYPENTENLNWILKKIQIEYLNHMPHYEMELHALTTQLLIQLDRKYIQKQFISGKTTSLYLEFQSLRLRMLTYCEEEWPIERMCRIVNLEKSQLYSYYKTFFHSTPKAELIVARIDKAKHLLTNEAMNISQVAEVSGFHNIYHFTRYFKKVCGCTPTEFTKQQLSQ